MPAPARHPEYAALPQPGDGAVSRPAERRRPGCGRPAERVDLLPRAAQGPVGPKTTSGSDSDSVSIIYAPVLSVFFTVLVP
jgi:hypothetical protein